MAELPPWQPLDGGIPVPDGSGPGRVVAVVASENSVERGWAGEAALELARTWTRAGQKVVVADGALHYPTLHAAAHVENVEGVSDAALFGVSVGRVAKPVDDGAFFLITAGTAVANANAVAASDRWTALIGGFLEAGVTLLLFVRDGDSGCAAFLGSASDIVVLAEPGERSPAVVRDLEGMVRAVTGPGGLEVAPDSGLRPPTEWTASGPGGRRRIGLLVAVVILLIVVVLLALGVVPLPGGAQELLETASLRPPGVRSVAG